MITCAESEELAGAFALGALPPDELQAARDHLATCGQPHSEARELQAVAAGLAVAAPEMEPPPALKSRLMDIVRAEAAAPVARKPGDGFWQRLRGWLAGPRAGYGLAGALAVVAVALLVWNVSLQQDDGGREQYVVDLTGAPGQLTVLPDQDVVIMDIAELDPAPAGHVYQAWSIAERRPASLGIVEVAADGSVHQAMTVDEAGAEIVAVTIERAPGVDQPTTDPVISAEL